MGKPIRVPEPVYDRVTKEAEEKDISRGAVVREWMKSRDEYKRMVASDE